MFCKTKDQLNIYFEVQGNINASQTLVLLNGLSQATTAWGLTIPYLKDDFKIVLLDFIFQGQSDKIGEWRDFDTHASDVISVLDNLKIDKAIVVGISYGSLVAQHLAANYSSRISKLILLSTFANKTPYYEAIELSWWRALEFGGYGLMLDIMLPSVLSENYFSSPIIPIDLMKQSRKDSAVDTQSLFKLMRATKERSDYREQLKKINIPSIVIQGEKDLLFPPHMAKEVAASIPNCKLHIIPNVGHTLNLEAVQPLCGLIKDFAK